jgi:hypothetical protein
MGNPAAQRALDELAAKVWPIVESGVGVGVGVGVDSVDEGSAIGTVDGRRDDRI